MCIDREIDLPDDVGFDIPGSDGKQYKREKEVPIDPHAYPVSQRSQEKISIKT